MKKKTSNVFGNNAKDVLTLHLGVGVLYEEAFFLFGKRPTKLRQLCHSNHTASRMPSWPASPAT